jgi:purine-nucleoside phosphorylase
MRKNVRECLTYIRSITDFVPKAALVLGSGLGGFTEKLDSIVCEIPYSDIPGFPVSTVSGHAGKFIMGYVEGVPLICMSGRVHYYEGYAPEDVVLPLRVMHALGAEFLFLTKAAGGISSDLKPGSLVLLRDHISLFIPNPLIGENDPDEGERFPDMSEVYDPKFRELVEKAASEADVRLESGVYCQLSGPSYETPAEIRLLQRLGADVVGMSTEMEAITAHHAGMKVCAISFVSNMAAGINTHALSHEEVKEAGIQAAPRFTRLVRAAIATVKSYEAE